MKPDKEKAQSLPDSVQPDSDAADMEPVAPVALAVPASDEPALAADEGKVPDVSAYGEAELDAGELDVVFVKGIVNGAVPAKARYMGRDRWDDLLADARWMHLSDAVGRTPPPKNEEVGALPLKPPRRTRMQLSKRDMATLCSAPPMETQGKLRLPGVERPLPPSSPPVRPTVESPPVQPLAPSLDLALDLALIVSSDVAPRAEPVAAVAIVEPPPSPPVPLTAPEPEPPVAAVQPIESPVSVPVPVPAPVLATAETSAPSSTSPASISAAPFDAWGADEGVWQTYPEGDGQPPEAPQTDLPQAKPPQPSPVVAAAERPSEAPVTPPSPRVVLAPPPEVMPRTEPARAIEDHNSFPETEIALAATAETLPGEQLALSIGAANQKLLLSGKKLTRSFVFEGAALSLPHSIVVTVTIEPAVAAIASGPEEIAAPEPQPEPVRAPVRESVREPVRTPELEPRLSQAETAQTPHPAAPLPEPPALPAPKAAAGPSSPLGFVGDLCGVVGSLIGSLFGSGGQPRATASATRPPASEPRAKSQAQRTARNGRATSPEAKRPAARRSDGRAR